MQLAPRTADQETAVWILILLLLGVFSYAVITLLLRV